MTSFRQFFAISRILFSFSALSACVESTLAPATAVTHQRPLENVRDVVMGTDEVKRDKDAFRHAAASLQKHLRSIDVVTERILPCGPQDNFTVNVTGSISLHYVKGINDATQTMTSAHYLELSWTDDALTWNASEYPGVETAELSASEVWTPGVFVVTHQGNYDVIKGERGQGVYVLDGRVGAVKVYSSFLVETLCAMDHSRFPYDTQRCDVMILTEPSCVLSLEVKDMKNPVNAILRSSKEWDLLNITTRQILNENTVEGVKVTLTLRRLTTYYTVCLVLPMVLTSYMNTLVFLLPLQAGEKISFLVTLSVSTSVFIGFFSAVMPRGLSTVPTTMRLLLGVMGQSLLVLLATVLVLSRHQRELQRAVEEDERAQRTTRTPAAKSASCLEEKSASSSSAPPSSWESAELGPPPYAAAPDSLPSPISSLPDCASPFTAFCGCTRRRVKPSGPDPEAEEVTSQNPAVCAGAVNPAQERQCVFFVLWKRLQKKLTASVLDRLFFLAFFLGNSVFQAFYLLQS